MAKSLGVGIIINYKDPSPIPVSAGFVTPATPTLIQAYGMSLSRTEYMTIIVNLLHMAYLGSPINDW